MASVLIVDDELDIREAISTILVEEGHQVRCAANGVEALACIAGRKPDIMLLDLMMPVMNGWDVLRTLRNLHVEIAVVVLSALADKAAPRQIAKPISVDQLIKLVDVVTSQAPVAARSPS